MASHRKNSISKAINHFENIIGHFPHSHQINLTTSTTIPNQNPRYTYFFNKGTPNNRKEKALVRPSIAQSVVYRATICLIIASSSVHLLVVAWVRVVYTYYSPSYHAAGLVRGKRSIVTFSDNPHHVGCVYHRYGSYYRPMVMAVVVRQRWAVDARWSFVSIDLIYGCRYACACYWIYLVWFFVSGLEEVFVR